MNFGGSREPWATESSAPMPSFSMSLRLEHLDPSFQSRASFPRLLGEVRRRADVGRAVAEIACEGHAGGDRAALGDAARRGRLARLPRASRERRTA